MALRSISNSLHSQQFFQGKVPFEHSTSALHNNIAKVNGWLTRYFSFEDVSKFSEEKKACFKTSDSAGYGLFYEIQELASKEEGEVEEGVTAEAITPRELLAKIRSIILKILNPACRCEKLIKVAQEYLFLGDGIYEDQRNAKITLTEAIAILEKEITNPEIKALFWLKIFERCREVKNRSSLKSIKKKAFLAEATALLGQAVNNTDATVKLWLAMFKKYEEDSIFWKNLQHNIDVLIDLIPFLTNYDIYCRVLLEISHSYESLGEEDNLLHVLKEAIEVAELIPEFSQKIQMLMSISQRYGDMDFSTDVIMVLEKVFAYVVKLDSDHEKLSFLKQIALRLECYSELKESQNIRCNMLVEISCIYEKQEDRINASGALKEAFEAANLILDVDKKIKAMISISQVYAKRDFLGDSLDILEAATEIVRAMQDDPKKLKLLNLLGNENKKYDHLKQFYQSSEMQEEDF